MGSAPASCDPVDVRAAPVRDRDGQLVGVLTTDDLVDPSPQQWIKKEATVADLMDPEIIAVYENDAVLVARTSSVSQART